MSEGTETILDNAAAATEAAAGQTPGDPAGNDGSLSSPAPAATEPTQAPQDGAPQDPEGSSADKGSEGAPAEYAEFRVPDGQAVDATLMSEFKPVAQELGLTQDQAQKMVDLHSGLVHRMTEAQEANWEQTMETWVSTAKNDQEIGGENFLEKVATARAALDKFGTPELLEAFDATGVGNHPEVLRVFYRIGKLVQDDAIRFGKAHQAPVDPAKVLFPNMA